MHGRFNISNNYLTDCVFERFSSLAHVYKKNFANRSGRTSDTTVIRIASHFNSIISEEGIALENVHWPNGKNAKENPVRRDVWKFFRRNAGAHYIAVLYVYACILYSGAMERE